MKRRPELKGVVLGIEPFAAVGQGRLQVGKPDLSGSNFPRTAGLIWGHAHCPCPVLFAAETWREETILRRYFLTYASFRGVAARGVVSVFDGN